MVPVAGFAIKLNQFLPSQMNLEPQKRARIPKKSILEQYVEVFGFHDKLGNPRSPRAPSSRDTSQSFQGSFFPENHQNPRGNSDRFLKRTKTMVEKNGWNPPLEFLSSQTQLVASAQARHEELLRRKGLLVTRMPAQMPRADGRGRFDSAWRNRWCVLTRDVRTSTFCQLTGFPLNHKKLNF